MLTFGIKREWYDMIARGEKLEEYREITPYYQARLEHLVGNETEIVLRNGYSSASKAVRITCLVDVGKGRPEWGAEPGRTYYKLVILHVEVVKPETFIVKARYCKRCGGLLTSKAGVRDGYGHVCKMRAREEAEAATPDPSQTLLDDFIKTTGEC